MYLMTHSTHCLRECTQNVLINDSCQAYKIEGMTFPDDEMICKLCTAQTCIKNEGSKGRTGDVTKFQFRS